MQFKKYLTKKFAIVIVIVLVSGWLVYHYGFAGKKAPSLVAVARGDIVEEVIVTGNTKPVADIDLAFQTSGRIAAVYAEIGSKVTAGKVLAELDTSQLNAQRQQAQAGVDAAQAKLDSLKRGTRPEDIQITETTLAKASQDLANDYDGVRAALDDAYAKSNDAVRNQLSTLFSSADTSNAQLTFAVTDSQVQVDAQSQRVLIGGILNDWRSELLAFSTAATASRETLDQGLQNADSRLTRLTAFLSKMMDALANSFNVTSATLTTYRTNVATAQSEVATATTKIDGIEQTIASQKIVVKQNQDQLALQRAGTTPEDIRAQEAAVAQAQASVRLIDAQLAQAIIRSPIDGTVTRQDAKVGATAALNVVMVSVISAGNLEITSNVPEADIGKINVGNKVGITLDAFPGETFGGKVVKIDPGETVVDGVVNFKVTVDFDKPDARFKSGLTANLRVETGKKMGALILPQIAVLQNDSGTFVERYDESGAVKQIPVTLGARDQKGNVEIVSGVREGDQVRNIGLKTQ